MAQSVVNKALGLRSFKNELSLPEGSLVRADNVVIDRDGIIEPRRGFKTYGVVGNSDVIDTNVAKTEQLLQYRNKLISSLDNKLYYDNGNAEFVQFDGVYSPSDLVNRIRGIEVNGNYYFSTATGIKKISALDSSEFTSAAGYILDAGAAKGLDGQAVCDTGTAGFFETQKAVAYRIVWGYKDNNSNLVLGSPSAIMYAYNFNSTDTHTVNLTFTIPEECLNDPKYFYQVYRSAQVDDSINAGTATPQDEMNLVFEDFPTTSDWAAGVVSTSDITPEDFREGGALLYTNPISGEGILQANERPPLAKDLVAYKGYTFYGNTKTRHKKQVNLISADILDNGDKFFISAAGFEVDFTFSTAGENIISRTFYLDAEITDSFSQKIDATARSMVRVINQTASSPVYAYYLSGVTDVPGLILFESRESADVEFNVRTSLAAGSAGADAFNPKLISTIPVTSDNEEVPNRLYYSRLNQPEAVPILNYFDIGAKNKEIRRVVALRDSLFVLKDDGVFRLSGTSPTNFFVTLSDSSAIILAADSVAVLNNQIYYISSQGVVSLSESGTPSIISRDIEDRILKPTSSQFVNFSKYCFGLASETDRAYLLFIPETVVNTSSTQCYRYNIFTNTWTRWTLSKTCGILNSADNKIYLGDAQFNIIDQERKNYERQDYSDNEYSTAVANSDFQGTTIRPQSVSNISVGDSIYQAVYISISRFNRLLRMLDNDLFIPDADFASTLTISNGANVADQLQVLIAKIAANGIVVTPVGSISTDITIIRDTFNQLIEELNDAASGTQFKNYDDYTTLVSFETIVTSVDSLRNLITVIADLPFTVGDISIFKTLGSVIEFAPQTLNDSSVMKHFREATIMFDQYNFTAGSLQFKTDISDYFEGSIFLADGNGVFGLQVFGESVFGGLSNQRPYRTLIPSKKQRCRFITLRFQHQGSREFYSVTGYSVSYKNYATEKAYRG